MTANGEPLFNGETWGSYNPEQLELLRDIGRKQITTTMDSSGKWTENEEAKSIEKKNYENLDTIARKIITRLDDMARWLREYSDLYNPRTEVIRILQKSFPTSSDTSQA